MTALLQQYYRIVRSWLRIAAAAIGVTGWTLVVTAWTPVVTACSQEVAQPVAVEAERLYADGMEHLAGGSVLEAEQEFQKLSKLPAYVGLTSLARLRLADTLFVARRHDEAIEAFRSFISRHDGNPNIPYAMYMIARSQFELAPTDLWIMPPVYEMDLTPVQLARQELEKFVRTYPRSRLTTDALAMRERCIELLYAHAQYVVGFYRNRGEAMGVVFRLHQAMQQFADRAHDLDNYETLAGAYAQLGWRKRAVEMWQAIGRRWPRSLQAQQAPTQIAALNAEIAAALARGEPGEMPTQVPPTAAVKPELLGGEGSS